MDQLPKFGRNITDNLLPTFEAYEGLLKAKDADIRSVRRETHNYGPHPRHVLDVYFPDRQPSTPKTVLVFLYGGGFYAGARVSGVYAGGLVYGNIGRYFTSRTGATVIVPDYRLLAHGARYPSGGEDIKFVVDWVKSSLAKREGYENVDIILLGNSAGGVHVATFLLDPVFEAARREVRASRNEGGVRLRGAIYLSTPFHWGDGHDEAVLAYLGEKAVFENSPVGRLQAAAKAGRLPDVKVLILVSEFDPQFIFDTARDFKQTCRGGDVEVRVLQGHNHISPQLSLGTGIEREEAWGELVAGFLRSCTSC
ncbi:alpha/beta-hydrolase [Xylaria intraflava]|nr:alpha/beta-hydrolase [Xylaria intraflava]